MATRVESLSGLGVRDRAAPRAGLAAVAAVCLALGLLSLIGPSSPTYDPWAWLIWGREVLHLNLDTRFGPSWKPLPVVVTTVFALAPGAAPALWVAVARAGGLAALAFAFRVARRLGGGVAGGLLAAGCLAVSTDFVRFAAVGDSEGLLVALLLAALELHLAGRRRTALWAAFGAALLRPESWPFVGLYALWLAWREPAMRRLVAGMTVAGAVLWFGPELWGSGNALRAGERARDPNPNALAFAQHPAVEVVKRFSSMTPLLVEAGAVLALAQAAVRRRLDAAAALALACLAWIGVVAVMTESGFSGNTRYLIAPAALACVAGGVAVGRAIERLAPSPAIATALGVVALAGVVALRAGDVATDAKTVRNEARLNANLSNAIDRAGGSREVKACGRITTGAFQVTLLAWELRAPIERIKLEPRAPGTVFRSPATPPPPAERAFHQVARTKLWQVVSTCPLNGRH
jgi:hypothetical protein